MAKQEIRQALNKVEVTGVVKEHKLNSGKGDNGKYINGSLVVKAGEFTEVTFKVFVQETNSKGKVKKTYENLKKILDGDFKTMAETSEQEAVKVRIWGNEGFTPQFKEEIYMPEGANEVKTLLSLDLGFGNVTIDEKITPDDYKATFDVEMFVQSVEEELNKDDEETGRVVVKGWTPVYGGSVIPLTIVAGIVEDEEGEFDFAEEVRSNIDPESTINFWGDIDFKVIIEKKSKGGSMGRAKTEEKRAYVHDLVAIGANFVEGDNEYTIEDIQQATVERENKIQEVKNKAENGDSGKNNSNKGAGIASRRRANRNASSTGKDKVIDISDDDLPF